MNIETVAKRLGVTRSRVYQIDELRPFPERGQVDPERLGAYVRQLIAEHRQEAERLAALCAELEDVNDGR